MNAPTTKRWEGVVLTPLFGRVIEARCLWCIKRIGEPRYRVGGTWETLPKGASELLSDLTDGICPECKAIELGKISAMRAQTSQLPAA